MKKRYYPYIFIPIIYLGISCLLISCNSVEPPPNGNGTDTTSQNFSFEILEFGDGFSSSYFNDVWVFDENDIVAVGYISPSDTVVNETKIINPNIIRWDGISWELQPFDGTSSGINGIWAVDSSLIYFAFGNILKYQNGSYEHIIVPGNWQTGQRIEKLWGSSENNIYGVGPWGTIVWYNGVQWTKIEFDTQWYLFDVTVVNQSGIAYAVARRDLGISSIIKIDKLTAEIVYEDSSIGLNSSVFNSITTINSDELWISGYDIWSYKISSRSLTKVNDLLAGYFIASISSFGGNDIYSFGGGITNNGVFIHYNGERYTEFNIRIAYDLIFGGSHCIKDVAVSVGQVNNRGYIDIIKRR